MCYTVPMKTSEKIISYLKKNGKVTGSELVDYLEITDRAVRKQLKTLLENRIVAKSGKPPRVYYFISENNDKYNLVSPSNIDPVAKELIESDFLYVTPTGIEKIGYDGFVYWCIERKLDVAKTADQYKKTRIHYDKYKTNGLIDGLSKINNTFKDAELDNLFYVDFYSIEIFGKTKLGQQLLFAKQSQNRRLMNTIADKIKPSVEKLIAEYEIDGIGFIPPTVKRELQLMKQIQKKLDLNSRIIPITKIKTPVVVPQKTLSKLADRVINARETITIDQTGKYKNILLIDDAVGSGATLNETAKKIRQKGICTGKIVGLAITGSFKGFDTISEV